MIKDNLLRIDLYKMKNTVTDGDCSGLLMERGKNGVLLVIFMFLNRNYDSNTII